MLVLLLLYSYCCTPCHAHKYQRELLFAEKPGVMDNSCKLFHVPLKIASFPSPQGEKLFESDTWGMEQFLPLSKCHELLLGLTRGQS